MPIGKLPEKSRIFDETPDLCSLLVLKEQIGYTNQVRYPIDEEAGEWQRS
jgi:hypothetical protein